MTILFIDSTYDITIGLLNETSGWLDFKRFFGQKASAIIQKETYQLLLENNIQIKDLKGVVTVAGPGFYTGLRLSEGFADVFGFMNIPHYSFYSYDVPFWCGVSQGIWVTKAYRGEYFIYEWNHSEGEQKLLSAKEIHSYLEQTKNHYIHSETSLDELLKALSSSPSTLDLLKLNPLVIYKEVLKNKIKKETFYFRAPEDEFRVSGK
ncbi:MAG: hypothetical protein AB7I27_05225 [Bacteriovoracaceae bacterium]